MTTNIDPYSAKIETDSVKELDTQIMPALHGEYRKWKAMYESGKLSAGQCKQQTIFMPNEGYRLICNRRLEVVIAEITSMSAETQLVLKRLKAAIGLAETKISTGNDMTMQARSQLSQLATNGSTLCAFGDVTSQYINNRLEIGRRLIKHKQPLYEHCVTAVRLCDATAVQSLRNRVASLADQLAIISATWKHNRSMLVQLRRDGGNV